MRPSELPKHKQHQAIRERQKWWGRNGPNVIAWLFLIVLGAMIVIDFMGII